MNQAEEAIKRILDKVGLTLSSVQRLRLPGGVVGKLCWVTIIVVVTLGVIVWRLNNIWLGTGVAVFIAFFATFCVIRILKFSTQHPDVALLEGAEFLVYHQKLVLGTKSLPEPPKHLQLPQAEPNPKSQLPDQQEADPTN